jgi:hypothetical protein
MAHQTAAGPLVRELVGATWNTQTDRAASWLDNPLMTQEKFRKFCENTVAKIREPHIKGYLEDNGEHARAHEDLARGLIRAIRREPSRGQSPAGAALARGAELVADVVGLATPIPGL